MSTGFHEAIVSFPERQELLAALEQPLPHRRAAATDLFALRHAQLAPGGYRVLLSEEALSLLERLRVEEGRR